MYYDCLHFFFNVFILAVLGLHGFSLVAASSGCSLIAMHGLLAAGASRCRARPLQREGFSSCCSWGLEHSLSSCGSHACLLQGMSDFPGSGMEPVSPALAGGHRGSPISSIFKSGSWGSESHRDWHSVADLVLLPQDPDSHLLGMDFQPLSFPPCPCQL